MSEIKKYGRTWFSTRKEAINKRKKGEIIYYDSGLKAYCLIQLKRNSFWGKS